MIWRVVHVDAGRRSKRAKLWRRARSLMATGLRGKKRFSLLVLLLLICLLMMNWLHALSTASTCSVTRSQLYPVLLSMLGDPASVRIFVQTLEKNGGCPDFKVVKSAALWDEKYRNNLLARVAGANVKLPKRSNPNPFYTQTPRGFRYCDFPEEVNPRSEVRLSIVYFLTMDLLDHPGYANFRRSLTQNGYQHEDIIQVVDRYQPGSEGIWLRRLKALHVQVDKTPPDRVLCLLDGLDALVLKSPEELFQSFMEVLGSSKNSKLETTVIFGSEELCVTVACVSSRGIKQRFETLSSQHGTSPRFLNAGLSIGTAGAFVTLFTEAIALMEKDETLDDQGAIAELMLDPPDDVHVVLDYNSRLFYNTPAVNPVVLELLLDSNRLPGVIHFPGLKYENNPHQKMNTCTKSLLTSYNLALHWLKAWSKGTAQKSSLTKNPDVVVSLTTTPARIDNLLPTINSLLTQTMKPKHIVLNVPRWSKRLDAVYTVPRYLYEIPGVIINRCDDFGPATKLLGALHLYEKTETLLITVDDEYMYPPSLVETLVRAHNLNPRAAYGFAGQVIDADHSTPHGFDVRSADMWDPKKNASVDILEGFLGAIYGVGFFSDSIYEIPDDCQTTDDVWFSAHLAAKLIPRIKLSMPFNRPSDSETGNDRKSNSRSNNVNREQSNIKCAANLLPEFQLGWAKNTLEPCSLDYTPLKLGEPEQHFSGAKPHGIFPKKKRKGHGTWDMTCP